MRRVLTVAAVAVVLVLAGSVAGAWMAGYPYRFPQDQGIVGDFTQWQAGWDSITAAVYHHPDDGRERVVLFFYRRRDGLMTTVTWEPLGMRCLGCPPVR